MGTLSDFITFRSDWEREAVEKKLHQGLRRRVLWATRPTPSLRHCIDWRLFLIFGCGSLFFAACWTALALRSPQPGQACFSLPIWLMGLGFLLHPWYTCCRRRRSICLIAGVVAEILEPRLFGWRSFTWFLKPDMLLAVREEADGRGDLLFRAACAGQSAAGREGWLGLPDVRMAEERLAAALKQQLPPRGTLRGDAVHALTLAQSGIMGNILLRGEHLRWVVAPRPCVAWRGNISAVVYGWYALLFAVALTWGLGSGRAEAPVPVLLVFWTVAFVMYAAFILYGLTPFWRRWQLARTFYVLTDRRALIVEAWWRQPCARAHAYPLRPRMVLSRVELPDGSGDLVFEEERGGKLGSSARRGFLFLPDLRAAERELSKAIVRKRAGHGG